MTGAHASEEQPLTRKRCSATTGTGVDAAAFCLALRSGIARLRRPGLRSAVQAEGPARQPPSGKSRHNCVAATLRNTPGNGRISELWSGCLLYTSDAADDM
eukprot:15435391-Alexandrium_andersonii.AAC.1